MELNVKMIRDSFAVAKPIAGDVANYFYKTLWEDYPQAKALFADAKMDKQKKALIGSLVFIVDNVDNPDKLVPYLKSMGERHVSYGTKEEHYGWVGSSLLKTFAYFFGDNWTAELEEQWTLAYNFIANTMLEGAKNYSPELPEIKQKAKDVCNRLLMDILEEGIDEEFENVIRVKVRKILFKVLEEESQELFKKAA